MRRIVSGKETFEKSFCDRDDLYESGKEYLKDIVCKYEKKIEKSKKSSLWIGNKSNKETSVTIPARQLPCPYRDEMDKQRQTLNDANFTEESAWAYVWR